MKQSNFKKYILIQANYQFSLSNNGKWFYILTDVYSFVKKTKLSTLNYDFGMHFDIQYTLAGTKVLDFILDDLGRIIKDVDSRKVIGFNNEEIIRESNNLDDIIKDYIIYFL